ncbi:MAG: hypothetical protein HY22_00570 [[Candidatus Thermochlorobacteriaceae] bacterium GBChlB]|nr:MAG: hypothetical protein HY22_00570 [[Candidatus Thermochlorobacteriaceae] bacterium GBChlB]
MKLVQERFIQGKAGKLEAIFNPVNTPKFLAVVCHPHPLYQGTMHNKVVVTAARALWSQGGAVVRFNFRGVMESEGQHDNGVGEDDDARAAIDFIVGEYPHSAVPIVLAGFSFGAWIAAKVGATDARVSHLIILGLPLSRFEFSNLPATPKPKLLLFGDRDQFCPLDKIHPFVETLSPPKTLHVIQDADHFFNGKQHELTAHMEAWIEKTC